MILRVASTFFVSALLGFGAEAATPPSPPPMTFQLVRAASPECEPDCPEWIAAEGRIVLGTAKSFKTFLGRLDARRRPVLITSGGGSVADAVEMGRLIRARGLAVAVAHTQLAAPAPANPAIAVAGRAVGYPAFCNSACPLVLAAGVERYASAIALIGVHQVKQDVSQTLVQRHYLVHYQTVGGQKEEVSRELASEDQRVVKSTVVSPPAINALIAVYYREMGVSPKLVDLMQTATPDQIHRLSADEETSTKLVTVWIDQFSAVSPRWQESGLAGAPVDAASGARPALEATGIQPLGRGEDGSSRQLSLHLTMRRGGAVVVASYKLQSGANAALDYSLASGLGPLRSVASTDPDETTVVLPTASFCRYAQAGEMFVRNAPPTQSPGLADPRPPLVSRPVSSLAGISALVEEACPNAPTAGPNAMVAGGGHPNGLVGSGGQKITLITHDE